MVIAQEPAQSLAAPHGSLALTIRRQRKQQDVALPLVIPLGMEMLDVIAQHPPQRALVDGARDIARVGPRSWRGELPARHRGVVQVDEADGLDVAGPQLGAERTFVARPRSVSTSAVKKSVPANSAR